MLRQDLISYGDHNIDMSGEVPEKFLERMLIHLLLEDTVMMVWCRLGAIYCAVHALDHPRALFPWIDTPSEVSIAEERDRIIVRDQPLLSSLSFYDSVVV